MVPASVVRTNSGDDMRFTLLPVPFIAAGLLLTGCTQAEPSPSPSVSPSASTSTSTSPSPSAAASDEPVEPAVSPPPVDQSTALTAQTAYEICTRTVADTYATAQGGTPDQFVYRSIEDSTVIARDDGLYFVLVDFTNLVTTPDLAESGTANCYLGGTVEQPYFASFGAIYRPYADQLDPYNPEPGGRA